MGGRQPAGSEAGVADLPRSGAFSGGGVPVGFWREPWGTQGEAPPGGPRLEGVACPHCREPAAIALPDGNGWCAACGGLVAPTGAGEVICRSCALPHASPRSRWHACAGGAELAGAITDSGRGVASQIRALLARRWGMVHAPAAACYVAAVRATVAAGATGEVIFMATAEPLILALPDRTLVLGTGGIAALEDEAQLAFVLCREESLARHGWIARRYRAVAPAGFWSLWRRRDDPSLAYAVDLSSRVGFGAEAEQLADREAIGALVAADYDPQAGGRALALLDHASQATVRFRLSRVRSRLLGRTLADIGRPALARLNREVYRRAFASLRDSLH